MQDEDLRERLRAASAAVDALPLIEKAIMTLEQKASFVRGMRSDKTDLEDVNSRLATQPEYVVLEAYRKAVANNERQQRIIADLYQVIASLADHAGLFDDPNVVRALDVAAYGEATDGIDLLPWPHTPLPTINVGELQTRLKELGDDL